MEEQSGDIVAVEDSGKISSEKTKGHYMDIGPGVITIELPCGHLDEDGKLHDTLTVGEMSGWEEDIIAGKGPIVPRLNQVIANCTKSFGGISDKKEIGKAVGEMTASDRLASLIAIRRVSLGDFYDVKIICPNKECSQSSNFSLDLSEIEIVRMEDQMTRNYENTLPSGTVVRWHIMTADDEVWLAKRAKKKEDVLTLAMLSRVDTIISSDGDRFEMDRDGKGFKESVKMLKSLSIRERHGIRRLFEKYEGTVDTEVEFECPACQHEWSADMDVGQANFFFPSDT